MLSKLGWSLLVVWLVVVAPSALGEDDPILVEHGKNMAPVPDTSLKLLEEETHGPGDCGCRLIIKRMGYPEQEGDEEEQAFSFAYDSNGDGEVNSNDIAVTSPNLRDTFAAQSSVSWAAHWKIGEGLPTWAHGHPLVSSAGGLVSRRKGEMSGNHIVTTRSAELVKYQVRCDRPCNGKIRVTSVFTLDDLSAYANSGLAVTRREAPSTYHDKGDKGPTIGNGTSDSGLRRQRSEAWYGDGSWPGVWVNGQPFRWSADPLNPFTPGADSATARAHVNFLGHNAECRWEGWAVANSNEACMDPSDLEDVVDVAKGVKTVAQASAMAVKYIDAIRGTTDSIPVVGTVAKWTKQIASLVARLAAGHRRGANLYGRGSGCSADASGSVQYQRGKDANPRWPRNQGSFVKKGGPSSPAGQTEERKYQVESSLKTTLECKIQLPCKNHEFIEKATSDTLVAVAYSGGFLPGEAKGRVQARLSWKDINLGLCGQDITQTGTPIPDPVITPSGGYPTPVTPPPTTPPVITPPVTGTGRDVVPGPSSTDQDGSDPSPTRRERLRRTAGIAAPQPPRSGQEPLVACHFGQAGPLSFRSDMPSVGYAIGVTEAECHWAGGEVAGPFSGRPMLPPGFFGSAGTEGDCSFSEPLSCQAASLDALWVGGECHFPDLVHPRACELLGGSPGYGPAVAELEPWEYQPGLEIYISTAEEIDVNEDGEIQDNLDPNTNGNHVVDAMELDADGDGFADAFVEEADCLEICVSSCSAVSGGFTCDDPVIPSEEEQIEEQNALFSLEESPIAPGVFPLRSDCLEVCGYPNHCAGTESTGFQCSASEGLPNEP